MTGKLLDPFQSDSVGQRTINIFITTGIRNNVIVEKLLQSVIFYSFIFFTVCLFKKNLLVGCLLVKHLPLALFMIPGS